MSKFKLMSSKGFTIIELLIVVTIIGLLASVIIASVQDARRASRDARMISDLKQVQNALELFRNANNGLYPCIPPATPGGPTNPRIVTMTSGCSDLTPYMATLPTSLNPAHTGTTTTICIEPDLPVTEARTLYSYVSTGTLAGAASTTAV
ncbi:prepilin-type N-terminal cleavage/methylation domain-containing protein [Patescibacteria group bacterium]|nr:prepilin-type N-terminal cleavage/methylation domain-containing protein [Patescibacteria group bacterium]